MSTPPDIRAPTESNDILLLDLSSEVDSNQNCIKGNPFVTSCAPNPWASPQTENPFSSTFGFFPTPDTDPFRDDPLSKSPTQSAPHNSQISLTTTTNHSLEDTVTSISKTVMNGGLNGDSDHLSQQMNGLSNKTMIFALNNCQWPLGGTMAQENKNDDFGPVLSMQNLFFDESLKNTPPCNGITDDLQPPMTRCKDSVVISPPPQNAKAGRGRRSAKSTTSDLFGADLFAAPSQTEGSSVPGDLFNNTPTNSAASSIAALGNLHLGPPATTSGAGMWGASTPVHSMFSMPGGVSQVTLQSPQPTFPQPSAFGALPIPPTAWGQQMPPQFGAPPVPQPQGWGQPPRAGPLGSPVWGQPPMANPFQPGPFSVMGDQQGPPRPPPRPPVKEAPQKVENSAFTSLDPLGDKEKRLGKDMFKDFQIAKPPAIPARKGEQGSNSAPSSNEGGAFDQYFSSKVGLPQEAADHDDFDINQISGVNDIKPAAVPAPSLNPNLLDAAFSPTQVTNTSAPAPGQGLNQNMFDEAFGAPNPSLFGTPPIAMSTPVVQTSGSSDAFGDPFGNPFA